MVLAIIRQRLSCWCNWEKELGNKIPLEINLDSIDFGPKEEVAYSSFFRIERGKVFFQGSHPRAKLIGAILKKLLRVLSLPDMEFTLFLGDAYVGERTSSPIFSFARDLNGPSNVILMPDFEALWGNHSFLKKVKKGAALYPWAKKKSSAFWRGATTGGHFKKDNFEQFPRSKAVIFSMLKPQLCDAKFTTLCDGDPDLFDELRSLGYVAKSCSIDRHLQYKYQLLIDGHSCAYSRLFWQLFSNCLILKQNSSHIQWYSQRLLPFVHYVPLEHDLSDLEEKILWANGHENEVLQIIANANQFAHENLRHSDIVYYYYQLLSHYAKKSSPCLHTG